MLARVALAGALLCAHLVTCGGPVAIAQVAQAAPTPMPTATASGAAGDPCTTLLSVVTRPTVTTSVCAVKNGGVVVETGYTNTVTAGSGGGVAASYPQALVRVGSFVRNLEFDVVPPSVARASSAGAIASGTMDAGFGAKYELGYTRNASYGVNVLATVPTGDTAFTAGGSTYAGNLNLTYTLSPVFALASTIGFESIAALANGTVVRSGAFVPSLVLTAGLPANSQLFAEAVYFSRAGVGLPSRPLYDGGFQKQLSSRFQVDVEAGFAPAPVNGQRQHYVGFGLAYGKL